MFPLDLLIEDINLTDSSHHTNMESLMNPILRLLDYKFPAVTMTILARNASTKVPAFKRLPITLQCI